MSFDDAAWQNAANLLLFSALRMVRAVVPSMKARGGGAILMSTSASVKEPIPNLGLSTVLRASVSALSKTLALELAADEDPRQPDHPRPHRHRSCPQLDEINGKKQGITRRRGEGEVDGDDSDGPLRRAPTSSAASRAFLLSDAASYMTGATVQVDGGLIKSVL